MIQFPKNFYWGAATSAYQVEGGITNDWTEFANAGQATKHYYLYEKDFQLAKKFGFNAFRFSIEWARIEPEEGIFDTEELAHYQKVINALRKRKIEPFVTLHHFTNPIWFAKKGGWANKLAPYYFNRYIDFLAANLGHKIKFWLTINEPIIYASLMYLSRRWMKKNIQPISFLKTIFNFIKAHRLAYRTIHSWQPRALVGVAINNIYFEAANNHPINIFLKKIADRLRNFYFLNKIKNWQDFIGLNYYFHNRINFGFNKNENKIVSDLGWEIYPKGIYYGLKNLNRYQKPVIITENGLADAADRYRADFIRDHLYWLYQAMGEGVDVFGYLHWSLLDNFEWEKGFWPRFGLIEVDYKTYHRKIRPSALFYAKICKTGQLNIKNNLQK